MNRILLTLSASIFLLSTAASAQKLGIWAHNGSSTYSGVLCGFDCSSRTNSAVITVSVLDPNGRTNRFGVNVSGRKNKLALLLLSAGGVKNCTTGIKIPGIKNTLLVAFPTIILSSGLLSNAYRGGACGGGFATLLPAVSIPSSAKGVTVSLQGVVTDDGDGATAFTRAIQVTFK